MGKLTEARQHLASDRAKEKKFEDAIAEANQIISTSSQVLASSTASPLEKVKAQTAMDTSELAAGELNRRLQHQRGLSGVTAERVRSLEREFQQLQRQFEAIEQAAARIPAGAFETVQRSASELQA